MLKMFRFLALASLPLVSATCQYESIGASVPSASRTYCEDSAQCNLVSGEYTRAGASTECDSDPGCVGFFHHCGTSKISLDGTAWSNSNGDCDCVSAHTIFFQDIGVSKALCEAGNTCVLGHGSHYTVNYKASECSNVCSAATCTTPIYGDIKVDGAVVKDTQNNAATAATGTPGAPADFYIMAPVNPVGGIATAPVDQFGGVSSDHFIIRKKNNQDTSMIVALDANFDYFSMKFETVSLVPDRSNIFAFGAGNGNSALNKYVQIQPTGIDVCDDANINGYNNDGGVNFNGPKTTDVCNSIGTLYNGNPSGIQFTLTVLPDKIRLSGNGQTHVVDVTYDRAVDSFSWYLNYEHDTTNHNNKAPFWRAIKGITHLQTYSYRTVTDTSGLLGWEGSDFDQVDACFAELPALPTDCVAAWGACDKSSCTETFTASTQPANGGQTCFEVYGIEENGVQDCTCPTVTAADITELNGKNATVVARFNTLRGKQALEGLGAATFAKVAEFDLRDLDATQKKEAIKTVVTATVQTMKLTIGNTEYEGARARSQDKDAPVAFAALTEEDRLTPQQPQVFVIANNYPQFVTVKRTNKVLVWEIENAGDQPVALPGTRRLLAATQGECDASITATNDDGVVYVSENVTPGCYYDAATDEVLVCPVGHSCDGVNKTPCAEGTYASSIGEPSCHNAAPGYAVGTGNTDKGDCATYTIDLQNCGCCTGCGACPGIGEGLTDAQVLSAVASQCGGTC